MGRLMSSKAGAGAGASCAMLSNGLSDVLLLLLARAAARPGTLP